MFPSLQWKRRLMFNLLLVGILLFPVKGFFPRRSLPWSRLKKDHLTLLDVRRGGSSEGPEDNENDLNVWEGADEAYWEKQGGETDPWQPYDDEDEVQDGVVDGSSFGKPNELAKQEDEEEISDAEEVPETTLERQWGRTIDEENSSAFVDRMDLADAYDLDEEVDDEIQTTEPDNAPQAPVEQPRQEEEETAVEKPQETTEISETKKDILMRKLHFSAADLKVLRPDVAAKVIAKQLRKPLEGMPRNWYLPGKVPTENTRRRILQLSGALLIVGSAILVGGQWVHLPAWNVALQSLLPSSDEAAIDVAEVTDTIEESQSDEEPKDDTKTPQEKIYQPQHSIEPRKTKEQLEPRIEDELPLDRFISKIENGMKGIFRRKA